MDESSSLPPCDVVSRSVFVFMLMLTETVSRDCDFPCQHGEKNFLKYFLKLVVVKA